MAFDLEHYKRRASRLLWDDLDFGSFRAEPLRPEVLRCLSYMHDVEYHTVCYLRDLLLTPAHADPRMTAFLSMWAYEELWHGEALAGVLEAHGHPHGDDRVAALRAGLGWRDRVRPLVMAAGGWWAGPSFVALQMAWGAVNESTTQAGYSLLARQAGHPVLAQLLSRIMRQEGVHLDFYTSQARARLAASAKAQHLTRWALARLWRPVGSGVMPPEETGFVLSYLLGDAEGRRQAERLDRRIDRLPGLAGLGLLRRVVEAIPCPQPGPPRADPVRGPAAARQGGRGTVSA